MEVQVTSKSHQMLFLNTLAFTIAFAAWVLNGVLVAFLVDNQIFTWTPVQIGWLLGIPVLTGAVFRLPAGILTDKYGGKWVYGGLLILCAIPMFLLSKADGLTSFALMSFGFGLTGTSFSIGIAYTATWYPKRWQGTALGIFGAGNAGAAITTLLAPSLLQSLTEGGANPDGWRTLPQIYAAALLIMGLVFLIFAENRIPKRPKGNLTQMLAPLKSIRVWRFGMYYFLVFGGFVSLSQWLVPYYMNLYSVSLVTAGIFATAFSLPSGIIRALGGWLSDKFGARRIMYSVLSVSLLVSLALIVPTMDIFSPGSGIMATSAGTVTAVSETQIRVGEKTYDLLKQSGEDLKATATLLPAKETWHEPLVKVGESIQKKQLLAKGVTHIYYPANIWLATGLLFMVGVSFGIGKAAVYKHIPDYFPTQVGVVGGMVGVLGGLGGFLSPIVFGYLLDKTGLWTSMWMFIAALSLISLTWMHSTVLRLSKLPDGFDSTLLEELGGEKAIDQAVELFYDLVEKDDSLTQFFVGVDMSRMRKHQKSFLKIAFSHPERVAGLSDRMYSAHKGMGLKNAHMDAIVGHLEAALLSAKIPKNKVHDALQLIDQFREDILGRPQETPEGSEAQG